MGMANQFLYDPDLAQMIDIVVEYALHQVSMGVLTGIDFLQPTFGLTR
jgi:hypothetical protein